MCSTLIMDGGEVIQNTATKSNNALLMTSLNHREETSPLSSPNSNPNDDGAQDSQSEDDDISVGCPSPALSCGVTIAQTEKLFNSETGHHFHHHHHQQNGSRSSSPFSPARDDPPQSDNEDSRSCEQDDYFKPLKKLKMMQINKEMAERQSVKVLPPEIVEVPTVFSNNTQPGGVKSFSILDILSHRPSRSASERATSEPNATQSRIVRPWDLGTTNNVSHHHLHRYHHHHHSIRPKSADFCYTSETLSSSSGRSSAGGSVASSDCCTSPDIINCTLSSPTTSNPGLRHAHRRHTGHHQARSAPTGKATTSKGANTSPLDALFQMTSKTFDELNGEAIAEGQANHLNLFNNRQQAKKKRKSRTAFTNHQIFELEKRFLYQKYLSPADRDEIAGQLGLSNAQVITWFQNRRAKLKRDMEELKKDVESAKVLTAHKSFLENVQDLGILKKKAATNAILADEKRLAAMALSLAPPIVK